jgi:hypothetical protein
MHTFAKLLTPEQYMKRQRGIIGGLTLAEVTAAAAAPPATCEVCSENPVWRLGGVGLCFTCTTGEADASEDYELRYTPLTPP